MPPPGSGHLLPGRDCPADHGLHHPGRGAGGGWTDVIQFSVFILSYGVIAFLLLDEFLWNPSDIYLIASSKESGITGYPHTAMVSFEFIPCG